LNQANSNINIINSKAFKDISDVKRQMSNINKDNQGLLVSLQRSKEENKNLSDQISLLQEQIKKLQLQGEPIKLPENVLEIPSEKSSEILIIS
jgi:16S rRNA G527 N7-methylase RsmG